MLTETTMKHAHQVLARKLSEHSILGPTELAALQGLSCHVRPLKANEDLVRQGDRPRVAALVLDGMLGRYHTLGSGKRQYLSFHIEGDLPDGQSLFIEQMDHAVCAIENATVALIPHVEIIQAFDRYPPLGFAIWRETLIDAAIFRQAITNNSSRESLPRMAHFFCEQYYRARAGGHEEPGRCRLPLNQSQIGDALGMSLVTANRTLQQLRRSTGIDLKDGMLWVSDWTKLAEAGEFDPSYLNIKREPVL